MAMLPIGRQPLGGERLFDTGRCYGRFGSRASSSMVGLSSDSEARIAPWEGRIGIIGAWRPLPVWISSKAARQ